MNLITHWHTKLRIVLFNHSVIESCTHKQTNQSIGQLCVCVCVFVRLSMVFLFAASAGKCDQHTVVVIVVVVVCLVKELGLGASVCSCCTSQRKKETVQRGCQSSTGSNNPRTARERKKAVSSNGQINHQLTYTASELKSLILCVGLRAEKQRHSLTSQKREVLRGVGRSVSHCTTLSSI